MSRFHSYLNSAKEILSLYRGEEPFASFIKKYFAKDKKYGSKDRKQISNLCYCYFRTGKAPPPPEGGLLEDSLKIEEKILTGLFLCSSGYNELLQNLKPEWNEKTKLPINEKLSSLNYQLSSVFPWKDELSEGIDYEKFCQSFFVQPDLFLRIRPGHAEQALLKLNEAKVSYEFISPFTIRLSNNLKAEDYFVLNKEVVIQDYNSQRVMDFLPLRPGRSYGVWDCCAGSGGKSIMAYDINPAIKLTVSDVRESILINLKKRFHAAGLKKYTAFTADLSDSSFKVKHSLFDTIICDVPCSGSGTWSRTPEQLYFFDKKKIDEYAALQKKIVSNAVQYLQPGGHLLYITCSVFRKENEEVVDFIKQQLNLHLVKIELLKGYDIKADTMFVSLLQKTL